MTLLKNAQWNMLSQFFKMLVQLINVIYLAKIIPPAEYGIMAMALVIINLGILLRDLGTSAAIIQKKSLSQDLVNTVFWLNSFMGLSLAIIVAVSAPFVSSFYGQVKLFPVLILLSITFPLSSCAATHLALLERESRFKTISFIEVSSSIIAVIVAITMANMGFGVFSLVGQAIILNLMSAIQFWRASKWRPYFKRFINLDELRSIFGFSANLSLFNFINYFSRNADSFIIGKFLSAAILGSYNLAYRLMLFPIQTLTFVANRSLYPILSRHQDDNSVISKNYFNCVFIILMLTTPLMCGLAFYSTPFIYLVFGSQWFLTAEILRWLAPTAIIQAVLSTTGAVFMAKAKTDVLMRLGFLGTFLQVSSFIIGVQYDIKIFAMCYFIANCLNFFPVMFCLFKIIDVSFIDFFKRISPIFVSSFLMVLFLYALSIIYPVNDIANLLVLVLFAVAGAFVYILALFLVSSDFRSYFIARVLKRY